MIKKLNASRYIYAFFILLILSFPLWSQKLPMVKIGMVLDGPWDQNEEIVSLLQQEILDLTKNEFDIRFPDEKTILGRLELRLNPCFIIKTSE